jgi:hypothetical protein
MDKLVDTVHWKPEARVDLESQLEPIVNERTPLLMHENEPTTGLLNSTSPYQALQDSDEKEPPKKKKKKKKKKNKKKQQEKVEDSLEEQEEIPEPEVRVQEAESVQEYSQNLTRMIINHYVID